MSLKNHFALLATYNQWMNEKLYSAARTLSDDELAQDRGAFFGSVLGTLNHLVVADRLWLNRLSCHPRFKEALSELATLPLPTRLDEVLYPDFTQLHQHRVWLDQQIIQFIDSLDELDLGLTLRYNNTRGEPFAKQCSLVLVHVFNHQTHHRGQVTTLLTQAGVEVGPTDLALLIPEAEPETSQPIDNAPQNPQLR